MAAKRFLNLFKSSHSNKREKENNDPLLGDYHHYQFSNGQRRSRRVNFQQSEGSSSRRRSCANEALLNEDDDSSEVTLTATEACRQQQPPLPSSRKMPPNPYLVVTEPKRNHGPRSCPGGRGAGHQFFDFDSFDNEDGLSAAIGRGGEGGELDRSLEARSEFFPTQQQHRRSSRRRALPLLNRGGVGADSSAAEEGTAPPPPPLLPHHPPFTEIGNGTMPGGRQRDQQQHQQGGGNSVSSSVRYKNVPWTGDSPNAAYSTEQRQVLLYVKEQKKQINELRLAYQEERARRKALQRELHREKEAKDRLMMEILRLQYVTSLLHQQNQMAGVPSAVAAQCGGSSSAEVNAALIRAACLSFAPPPQPNLYSAWSGGTPASAAAVPGISQQLHQTASMVVPETNAWTPCRSSNVASFDFLRVSQSAANSAHFAAPPGIGGGGGPGECLAPMNSSSSLLSQQQQHQQQQKNIGRLQQGGGEDEIKVFRTGQHDTDSFSGSSRPTTRDLNELKDDKNDLLSDESSREQGNLTSPEIGRGAAFHQSIGSAALLGLSFSADDCPALLGGGGRGEWNNDPSTTPRLFPDTQLSQRDDGYATSETNMSASGAANSECTIGGVVPSPHMFCSGGDQVKSFGQQYKQHSSSKGFCRRRSLSTGQINASSF